MILPRDLRLRLVTVFLLVATVSQLTAPAAAAVMLALATTLALLSRPPSGLWHRLLHMEAFVILLALALPFTIEGHAVFSAGPLSASYEGLVRAGLLALKISASGLLILTFLGSEPPERLGAALQGLKVPEALVKMLVLTVRYLSLIRTELSRLREAMTARAFVPRTSRHTWKSYGNLTGMLLLRAMERAGRVEEAMRCRGYAGRLPLSALPPPRAADWLTAAVPIALTAFVLLWERA